LQTEEWPVDIHVLGPEDSRSTLSFRYRVGSVVGTGNISSAYTLIPPLGTENRGLGI